MTTPPPPEQMELHSDRMCRRDEDLRIESAVEAERFIEDVGFANTLTDARCADPSLYIAVCGRRDVSLPAMSTRNRTNRPPDHLWVNFLSAHRVRNNLRSRSTDLRAGDVRES
jgi:hypothetical protein